MKIPFLPLHIVTSGTLDAKLKTARTEGIEETRRFRNKQIAKLLHNNATQPVQLLARRK